MSISPPTEVHPNMTFKARPRFASGQIYLGTEFLLEYHRFINIRVKRVWMILSLRGISTAFSGFKAGGLFVLLTMSQWQRP